VALAEVNRETAQARARYWDRVVDSWIQRRPDALWRAHSDALNSALLARWLTSLPHGRLLKTDLFDEAVAEGMYPLLQRRARTIVGIDVSPKVVRAAGFRYPLLGAVAADVLQLPFRSGQFDAIVSISTLDHFDSLDKIGVTLTELYRILAPGGILIVTLDNGSNPFVALRNRLPYPLLRSLRMVPYRMGATYTGKSFLGLLRSCSFEILDVTYTVHCPRFAAAVTSRVVQRFASVQTRARFLGWLGKLERLDQLPTRALTGHFVAALAKKP